jgi:hypothetical protein
MTTKTKGYAEPHEVSDVLLSFPGRLGDLLPPMSAIPKEYEGRRAWVKFQEDWFYSGLKSFPEAKEGINQREAMHHLKAIQGSFEPKHEHKTAAVAWLASLWLKKPT